MVDFVLHVDSGNFLFESLCNFMAILRHVNSSHFFVTDRKIIFILQKYSSICLIGVHLCFS